MIARRIGTVLATLAIAGFAAPAAAFAHAQLLGTSPARGAVLTRAPASVVFRFSEPVEANFGAVRVYDAAGRRVDDARVFRPQGHSDQVAVGLRDGIGDGGYTAAYRVISADGHPVEGGTTFTVGHAAAPARSVAAVLGNAGPGPATDIVFGIARGATYLATALTVGVIAFLLIVWSPALREVATGEPGWREASQALAGRARGILLGGASIGVLSGVVGIVAQGAVAAGSSWWSAADPAIVGKVLGTRFGVIWGLRVLVFGALALAVVSLVGQRRWPVLRPAVLGATGLAPAPGLSVPKRTLVVLPALLLAVAPALAGHAATEHPIAVLMPLDIAHVLAMSVWLGGLLALLTLVPAATRRLEGGNRSAALAGVLVRFSPLALGCVAALLVTGLGQAYVDVRHLDALTSTAFGRAVLIKAGLLLALVALGAVNRRRVVPALRRIAAHNQAPGVPGVLLRRTLRAEVALLVVVLGVTSALVSYAPPVSATRGPFSATTRMGPIETQLTVDPAAVGANQLHIYLFDARTGAQFTGTKQLTVTAAQPHHGIGGLGVTMHRAGPGHYLSDGLQLVPGGSWTVRVTDRVSDFDEYTTTVKVPVR